MKKQKTTKKSLVQPIQEGKLPIIKDVPFPTSEGKPGQFWVETAPGIWGWRGLEFKAGDKIIPIETKIVPPTRKEGKDQNSVRPVKIKLIK